MRAHYASLKLTARDALPEGTLVRNTRSGQNGTIKAGSIKNARGGWIAYEIACNNETRIWKAAQIARR